MKRFFIFLLCTCLAALAAFTITRWVGAPSPNPSANQLEWLQTEFKLSPAQVAEVKALQTRYQPVCQVHCQKIQQARAALAGASAETKAAAQAELERVKAVCRDATRSHLQQVAAVMAPEEGARFLALVLPKLSGETHDAPCGIQ